MHLSARNSIEKVPWVDHGLWVWVHGFMGWLVPTHTHTHGYPYPQPMWVTHTHVFPYLGTCLIKLNCTVAEDAEAEMETIQECDDVPDDVPNDDPFTQEWPQEQTEDRFGPQDSHDHKHQDKSDEDDNPGSQELQEESESASNFGHEKDMGDWDDGHWMKTSEVEQGTFHFYAPTLVPSHSSPGLHSLFLINYD